MLHRKIVDIYCNPINFSNCADAMLSYQSFFVLLHKI